MKTILCVFMLLPSIALAELYQCDADKPATLQSWPCNTVLNRSYATTAQTVHHNALLPPKRERAETDAAQRVNEVERLYSKAVTPLSDGQGNQQNQALDILKNIFK